LTELLNVQLLSSQPFQVDEDKILAALQERCGQVEKLPMKDPNGFYVYAFHDYTVDYVDRGSIPAQVLISTILPWSPDTQNLQTVFQQSKFWPDAEKVVRACRHTIMITDFLARGLPYRDRLKLFTDVVRAMISVVGCDALYWNTSEQFIKPTVYMAAQTPDQPNLIFGAVNVRMFNIANRQPGECLMDTIGLHVLGLPDLQCHFVKLDPNQIARVLYNTANYIFIEGDVINDGETVAGLSPDDHWFCRHEDSIVEPKREVLDINPGAQFNAGRG